MANSDTKRKRLSTRDIQSYFTAPTKKMATQRNVESNKPQFDTDLDSIELKQNQNECPIASKSEKPPTHSSASVDNDNQNQNKCPIATVSEKPPTQSSSSVENNNNNKTSDLKNPRVFKRKWCDVYSWLQFDEEENSMLCSLCLKHKKSNALTSECRNFRTSTLSRHAESTDHREAILAESISGSFEKAVKKVFDEKEEALIKAMTVSFWMAKEDLAIDKFESLLNLLEYLETPALENLKTGQKVTYKSDKSCVEFIEALSSTIRHKIMGKIESSPFVSILCDESTDIGVKKKLSVYVKVVDPDTFQPETLYVCNEEIEGGTGKVIYEKLKSIPGLKEIPREKITGLGTDGAKVMTGLGTGLTGFMIRDNPMLVNYHCVAHRLALVTSQAADEVPFLVDYQSVLTGIFYFFKHSANRVHKLIDTQAILNDPQLKVKEVHQVRWMSIYLAVETVYKILDSLITFFNQDKDPKSKGFAKKMIQYDFIATTCLLMDVLPVVTELCLLFQKANLDVSLVKVSVDNCIRQLTEIKEGKSPHLYKLQNSDFSMEHGKVVFKGNHIVQGKQNIDSIKVKFIDAILGNLSRRFPDDDSNIMYAFAALSMRPISLCSREERSTWGNDKLEVLIKQYGEEKESKPTDDQPVVTAKPLIQPDATRLEWSLLKDLVVQEGYPRDKMDTLYHLIAQNYKPQFPNMLTLAALAVTAPIHTADCERGFSAQNSVKTSLRNRLGSKTVDNLLMIKIEGGEMKDFDFSSALLRWRKERERKIFSSKK